MLIRFEFRRDLGNTWFIATPKNPRLRPYIGFHEESWVTISRRCFVLRMVCKFTSPILLTWARVCAVREAVEREISLEGCMNLILDYFGRQQNIDRLWGFIFVCIMGDFRLYIPGVTQCTRSSCPELLISRCRSLGDASMIGGVAVATMLFDLLYWNMELLRVSKVCMIAQAWPGLKLWG